MIYLQYILYLRLIVFLNSLERAAKPKPWPTCHRGGETNYNPSSILLAVYGLRRTAAARGTTPTRATRTLVPVQYLIIADSL